MSPTVSSQQLLHFLQIHISGRFQQYDYGEMNNSKIYGSSTPPEYNLKNVTAPIYLYSCSEDFLVDPNDVENLKDLLPNVKNYEMINDWNHMDIMYGKDSRSLVYKNILQRMNSN